MARQIEYFDFPVRVYPLFDFSSLLMKCNPGGSRFEFGVPRIFYFDAARHILRRYISV